MSHATQRKGRPIGLCATLAAALALAMAMPMPRLPWRHHRANDEIADAVIVPGVPYTHTIDTTEATEATEATDAGGDQSGAATVWYSRRGGNPTPQRRANT